jgi:hypothetical protein
MIRRFNVSHNGIIYDCYSEIKGTTVLRQIIHVIKVGSKQDTVTYSANSFPADIMDSIARIIAKEIITRNIASNT